MLVRRRVEDGAAGGEKAHASVDLDLLELGDRRLCLSLVWSNTEAGRWLSEA